MDAVQDLLVEIERVQCLVCLARAPDGRPLGAQELLETLGLSPAECDQVLGRLAREGLVRTVPDPRHPLPREVRLTDAGHEAVRSWRASVPPVRSRRA